MSFNLNFLYLFTYPFVFMVQPSFIPPSFTPSPFQRTVKNNFRLTCLTTNGGLLSLGILKLSPRFSWADWSWKKRLVKYGEGGRDCMPWGSLSRLLSLDFIFILLKGNFGPFDVDKGLRDLHLSSWNPKKETIFLKKKTQSEYNCV